MEVYDQAGYCMDTVLIEEFEYGKPEEMDVEKQTDYARTQRVDAWRFTDTCGKCGTKDKLMHYHDGSTDIYYIICYAVNKQRGESTPGITCGWSISL
jgi:hypothetical protein